MSGKQLAYHKKILPDLKSKLQTMALNNLEIVAKDFSAKLPDNKLKTALKSRRLAVENVIWACREVDRIDMSINNIPAHEAEDYFLNGFYRQMLPYLIDEIKGMVENYGDIIVRSLEGLTDERLETALVARRQAAEDTVWASKLVDELTREVKGKPKVKEQEEILTSWTKQKASM